MTLPQPQIPADRTGGHHYPPEAVEIGADALIGGVPFSEWRCRFPLLDQLLAYQEVAWFNPEKKESEPALGETGFTRQDIAAAADRFDRFRPFFAAAFPETRVAGGRLESPLRPIPGMRRALAKKYGVRLEGGLLLKCDHLLPIAGSVKGRGGIYEVIKYAEEIALTHRLLPPDADTSVLLEARAVFAGHRLAVGSTGNLGLAVGIVGARFGFQVVVHMAAEARPWKKALLRRHGVEVVEHQGDYSQAVAEGRRQAAADRHCHFIDDENSADLFLGYAVAGRRIKEQLDQLAIPVNADHPLLVHLPCGVGGGPGGITFGLKQLFGDHVHCFFAEPTHSPAMLLGLATGLHDRVAVRDFGLNNITAADGLAVGRPSGFIGRTMAPLIDGVFTVNDAELFRLLALLAESEKIFLEPSALAGMAGPPRLEQAGTYLKEQGLDRKMAEATHMVWATGGRLVPEEEMASYRRRGIDLSRSEDTSTR
jgi:D-serine dehydratase